jgi:hypothetical protein
MLGFVIYVQKIIISKISNNSFQSIRGFTHFYFFHKKSHQSKHIMLKNFPSFMYSLNVGTIPSKKLQIYSHGN